MSAELLSLYDDDQRRRGLQFSTRLLRKRQIELFEKETRTPIEDAASEQISAWLDSRKTSKGEPISAKTRSCYLTTFSAFFTWAIEAEYLDRSPVKKSMRPKVHAGLPNPIPEDALERALNGAKPLLWCWIALEAYGGLRCQEVALLSHEDVFRDDGMIHVRHGKGGEERYVPLHPKITMALDNYDCPASGRLWPFATPASVSQRINRYFHSIGITHTAHKNRHRFATKAFEASGQDLLTTKNLLGHKNVATTQIYAQVSDELARNAVALIA